MHRATSALTRGLASHARARTIAPAQLAKRRVVAVVVGQYGSDCDSTRASRAAHEASPKADDDTGNATHERIDAHTSSPRVWATCLRAARRLAWRGALVVVELPRPLRIDSEVSRDSHRPAPGEAHSDTTGEVRRTRQLARTRALMTRRPGTSMHFLRVKEGCPPESARAQQTCSAPVARGHLTLIPGVDDAMLEASVAIGMHRLVLSLLNAGHREGGSCHIRAWRSGR